MYIGKEFYEALNILKGCEYLLYGALSIVVVGLITGQGIGRYETYRDRETGEEIEIRTPDSIRVKDNNGRYKYLDKK